MKQFILEGLGTALPGRRVSQHDAAAWAEPRCCDTAAQVRLLGSLYRRSSIGYRHTVVREPHESPDCYPDRSHPGDPGPTTADRMARYTASAAALAEQAGRTALHHARLDPDRIDHLVTVSCTGFEAPGFDVALIKQLGLPMDVSRSHIGFMGCHGALNGLRVASALAGANTGEHVMLCAVELCTLHFGYGWRPQQIVANALFADGAAAIVGSCDDTANTTGPRLIAAGGTLLPDCEDLMTWRITDHGFAMTLSPRVPTMIEKHLRPWLDAWLDTQGLTVQQVGGWAVHPGGPRVLDAVQACLELDDAALSSSRSVLRRCGNMSSPTTLFILEDLLQRGVKGPCVAMGFGPGLAIEAALLEVG